MNKLGEVEHSSGNVFIDLGFDKDEAEELLTKAKLLLVIRNTLKERKITPANAMSVFCIPESILNQRFDGASIAEMKECLVTLGIDDTDTENAEIELMPIRWANSIEPDDGIPLVLDKRI